MTFFRIRERKSFQRIQALTKRFERFWIPAMLLGGLTGDVIQYTALDLREKFIIMGVYVCVAFGALLVLSYPRSAETKYLRRAVIAAPFLHQFAVGGLLSTALLFYWFSGALSASWPVLVGVAALMMFNEFLREHFLRPSVQVGVLTFALISLLAILFSFVFNSLSPAVFVASGVLALLVMTAFSAALVRVGSLPEKRNVMFVTIVAVFVTMNVLYFANVIPPIPLALRDAGVYHSIIRAGGDYTLVGEDESFFDKLIPGQTIHVTPGEPVYAYTSVFAPTDLSTTIVHVWEYYDPSTRAWVTKSKLSYTISGGRDDGFRGYTLSYRVVPGTWRVSVETPRGQVLGRIGFTAVAAK